MVIAVSTVISDVSPPPTVYSIVYSRKGQTCDQFTVVAVTAAAPLLRYNGGKCMLEPQKKH